MTANRSRNITDALLRKLLKTYEEETGVDNGVLSYRTHDVGELYELLPDAFVVHPDASRSERVALFRQALVQGRMTGPLTAHQVIRQAESIRRRDLAVPERRFTLWTKFRARQMPFHLGFVLRWGGVRIRTAARLPRWLSRGEYLLNGVGRIYPDRPWPYGFVILTCEGRQEDAAVDRLLDTHQLILGLINLYETWGRRTAGGGRNWTEGVVWSGPEQFLFDGREFRGEERIWYNPDYNEDAWNRHPSEMARILQMVPRVRRSLAALERHPLRQVLTEAILSM